MFDATPGSPTATSFLTVEEGDVFAAAHLYASGWTSVDLNTKQIVLQMATRELSARVCFNGVVPNTTQSLPFPRSGLLTREGQPLDITIVPTVIKYATFELSLILLKTNVLQESDVSIQGLTSLKVGSIQLGWKQAIPYQILPINVRLLIPQSWLCQQQPGQPLQGFTVKSLGRRSTDTYGPYNRGQ